MSKTTAALLSLPLVAALAWAGSANRALRADLRAVEDRLARLEAKPRTAPETPPAAPEIEALRAEIARVEAKAVAAPARATSAGPAPAVTAEDVRQIVDERIEAKASTSDAKKAAAPGGGDDRKIPLHDLAKELALDPQTQARVAEAANRAKREIFDVLKVPRADGTEMAADLMQAFLSGDAQKTTQVFQRLFTEKVPGSDQTYLAAVALIQDRARQTLRGTMGDAVYGRWEHMGVRPENIETGWDPWADYVKEKGLLPGAK
jgi:hypothetical protein